jgi:hypothetical protein
VEYSGYIAELARQRQNDFLREAQHNRLIAEAEAYAADQAILAVPDAAPRPRARWRQALRRIFAAGGELAAS